MPKISSDGMELTEKLVQLKPVSKTVKGGRKRRFSALVVVGDGHGGVGAGMGKAQGVPDAIRKAATAARNGLIKVPLAGTTIPHQVIGRVGASRILLKPASEGTGVIAGGPVRAVVEAAGVKDLLTKELGSNNPINCVAATIDGLKNLRRAIEVAQARGKTMGDLPIHPRIREKLQYTEEKVVPDNEQTQSNTDA